MFMQRAGTMCARGKRAGSIQCHILVVTDVSPEIPPRIVISSEFTQAPFRRPTLLTHFAQPLGHKGSKIPPLTHAYPRLYSHQAQSLVPQGSVGQRGKLLT